MRFASRRPGAYGLDYYRMSTSVDLTGTIAVTLGASVGMIVSPHNVLRTAVRQLLAS
jgi:hypothetical protein